jgi:hypothetical protein
MRIAVALAVLPVLFAGCTANIPVKADFGTSALVPAGDASGEFSQFNAYDPAVGPLVANQICATPYAAVAEKSVDAAPGQIVEGRGACRTHVPFIGDGNFLPALPVLPPLPGTAP